MPRRTSAFPLDRDEPESGRARKRRRRGLRSGTRPREVAPVHDLVHQLLVRRMDGLAQIAPFLDDSAPTLGDAPLVAIAAHRRQMAKALGRSVAVEVAALDWLLERHAIAEPRLVDREFLEHLVAHGTRDPLTGLLNRSAFEALVRDGCERSGPVALLLFDVDRFKDLNDSRGHAAGDAALAAVATELRSATRQTDACGRVGGDELAVAVRLEHAEALQLAERIRRRIEEATDVTVSVGVATATSSIGSAALMKAADAALYRAKGAGRNRVASAGMVRPSRG